MKLTTNRHRQILAVNLAHPVCGLRQVARRARLRSSPAEAGLEVKLSCHVFRATATNAIERPGR
jgi:hypothetical protein